MKYLQVSISPSLSWSHCAEWLHRALCYSTLSDMQIPRWDSEQQPPAQTASRTEALQPASDVWIKVGLLPSCLHNNTLDTSSAAVGACGSDYLAGRRSLSLTCKWTWHCSSPGLSEQKCWAQTGPYIYLTNPLIKPHCLVALTFYPSECSLAGCVCIFSAWRSMSWVTARASELDWFELSLHVCSWLPTGQRLPHRESGPKEADSEVSAQGKKKDWQWRWHGDSMGSHTLFLI